MSCKIMSLRLHTPAEIADTRFRVHVSEWRKRDREETLYYSFVLGKQPGSSSRRY
jgi:hypothetical protein